MSDSDDYSARVKAKKGSGKQKGISYDSEDSDDDYFRANVKGKAAARSHVFDSEEEEEEGQGRGAVVISTLEDKAFTKKLERKRKRDGAPVAAARVSLRRVGTHTREGRGYTREGRGQGPDVIEISSDDDDVVVTQVRSRANDQELMELRERRERALQLDLETSSKLQTMAKRTKEDSRLGDIGDSPHLSRSHSPVPAPAPNGGVVEKEKPADMEFKGAKIKIILRFDGNDKDRKRVTVHMDQPFGLVKDGLRQRMNIDAAVKLIMEFDGETIGDKATPASIEMDEDDGQLIDVRYG